MSTKSRHNGLSSDDRSQIRSAILNSREMLESEFERQLERYGVYDDDRVPLSKLGHLSLQDRETRREIDAALERELEATEDYQRAYRNYIREATKEYLNRYVGLKTIEARGLVTETLATKAEYGNRSYLHYTVDEIAGELTDASDDGLGVALDLAFQEIGAEIRILFEDTDYTAIEPEFTVRRDVFEELGELDDDAWAADEAIGWVYQYFGEKEREEIDKRIDEENYKVQDTDIATKTQLFTPRYIVEWMVDNSLGRLWLEMHGDETNIADEERCFYLAPLDESLIERDVKDIRDITVLDPACGSGHMLFYAFDVLYEMYLEQGGISEKYIPREILKHNLYGIDIDPGAVQIAALALYTKAKERAPNVEIEQINVISADAVLVNGEKKQEVLNQVETELERRVLEQVWRSFENIREWGSLVRIEERIEDIIEEEREEIESIQAQGQVRFTGDGEMTTQSSFIRGGEEVSWETLKQRLLDRVRDLTAEALEADDTVQEMFVGEVQKSVELMDYFIGDYDVVVSNPPYLGSGKMGEDLKQYIKDHYIGTRDVYAAFIQRCWEFAGEDSYATLVTPENYMFLYSYRKLRKNLISNHQFVEGAHLSRYGFDQQKDAYTIPFVLRNSEPIDFKSSRFYRMTHEQEEYAHYEDKISGLKRITESHRRGETHTDVYVVNQNSFKEISRSPFIYWFGQELLQLFIENKDLGEISEVRQGLSTGNDDLFMRKHWEIPSGQHGDKYVQFQKSGTDSPYYDIPQDYLNWSNNGKEIENYEGSVLRNEGYYFMEGLTVRPFGDLVCRQAQNLVFGKPYFVKSEEVDHNLLNGLLNSTLYRFLMNGINPSLNVQVGDVKTLPMPTDLDNSETISSLVQTGVNQRKNQSALNESSFDYTPEVIANVSSPIELKYNEEMLTADLEIIHGIIDEILFDSYRISNEERERIYESEEGNISKHPHIMNSGSLDDTQLDFRSEVPTKTLSKEDYSELVSKIGSMKDNSLRKISGSLQVSPYTVAKIRREHNLYTKDEKTEMAGRILSFYLGVLLGRWESNARIEPEENGILVFGDEFEQNISNRIYECMEASSDKAFDYKNKLEKLLNKDVTAWLKENFFRYHHTKEYRRRGQRIPIYWHLESNGGAFSCFLYYHQIDSDTLPKLRGKYVDKKIEILKNRLDSLKSEYENANDDLKRDLRNKIEETENQLEDVKAFGENIDNLINEGFEPDFKAGIWENIQKVDEYDLLQTELDKL